MNALRGSCVWLLNRYGKFSRAEFTSRLEPIKFYKFPIHLTSERLRFIIARTAKFLPHEQFALEFYYRLKFYAAVRDLNFATVRALDCVSARLKFTPRQIRRVEAKLCRKIDKFSYLIKALAATLAFAAAVSGKVTAARSCEVQGLIRLPR